jgi:hypothetical protein
MQRIKMVITNNNAPSSFIRLQQTNANLGVATPKAPSALNADMLQRVHNVRPGCGSCGRKH